jgi:hypothetical protein
LSKRPNPLKIPIPLEVLLELHRRHQAGEPVYKLAREVGVSRCTLSLRFQELDLAIRHTGKGSAGGRPTGSSMMGVLDTSFREMHEPDHYEAACLASKPLVTDPALVAAGRPVPPIRYWRGAGRALLRLPRPYTRLRPVYPWSGLRVCFPRRRSPRHHLSRVLRSQQ